MRFDSEQLREVESRFDLCAQESRTRIAYLRTSLRGLQETWLSSASLRFQQDCHEALERSDQAFQVAHTLALRLGHFRQRMEAAES